ncbi:hypothetical protein EGX98_08520 [Fusobacterium necrophorum]|uniref:Uncharacterized protein n=2 Tax=Fusobacterium necrophorum TaxID=859 RepID=A0AB73BVY5_9FUSO|nr:hypothetical protein [Fusobacterium necrophorum]AYZ74067.1 hypothetical protein EGX98_08520 [Fusobacterium necrophorum]AZW10053.1 hypothetical protein EO219_11035 [Fusobacterium necrophorum subsp. necrophorum]KDE61721.1 hypothetical protein FUSO4_11390 [Fusobacterium necrophorum DJ-1]KDE62987.1 hypothetical protein FUSO3_06340 [Fusobacterium necrophorum BL]KDE69630.1 hypothetical protein FUSO8_11185 [Fusobacterium necrophorum DJ-2]
MTLFSLAEWERASISSITWQYINDNSLNSPKYAGYGKDRDKYKKWFQDNESWIDSLNVFEFWSRDNKEMLDSFIDDFIIAYNSIAERNFYIHIER